MTTHPTPDPIRVTLRLKQANVEVAAADRRDTSVDVRPTDPDDPSDVWAAEHTTVELTETGLEVTAPDQREPGDSESIDVTIGLPADSSLEANGGAVRLRARGRLGECRVRVGSGTVSLDEVAGATVGAGSADVAVIAAAGDVSVEAASGRVRLERVDGSARVESASGTVEVGEVEGELTVRTASGAISARRAGSSVRITATAGRVRLGRLMRGQVSVETKAGDIELGVDPGTAAWLDLRSVAGTVRSELDEADGPGDAHHRLEIRASSTAGDVTVRRSAPVGA